MTTHAHDPHTRLRLLKVAARPYGYLITAQTEMTDAEGSRILEDLGFTARRTDVDTWMQQVSSEDEVNFFLKRLLKQEFRVAVDAAWRAAMIAQRFGLPLPLPALITSGSAVRWPEPGQGWFEGTEISPHRMGWLVQIDRLTGEPSDWEKSSLRS